jgi:UDP-2,3-diacylglucosamine pyrophosphatase LpxH
MHLGSVHCKAQRLLDFLKATNAPVVYLVGDVIDHPLHLMKLPKLHFEVILELIAKASSGTKLIYIPGNHDSMFRHYVGQYGNITVTLRKNYVTKAGAVLLVTHGDETDVFGLRGLLTLLVFIEKYAPISLWELVRKLLRGHIRRHTATFERKMRQLSKKYSGVICGHIHAPIMRDMGDCLYVNTGDWVDSCTALVEDETGALEIIRWTSIKATAEITSLDDVRLRSAA